MGLVLLLAACQGAGARSTPTRTTEELLGTARARAESTRAATFQTPPPTPITPSPTAPLVTDTPEPTLTPTPDRPVVTANYNANVREGPGEEYPGVDFLLEGQRAIVIGRYENEVTGTWWAIERIEAGKDGWVWSGAVELFGDANLIPFLDAPPLNEK